MKKLAAAVIGLLGAALDFTRSVLAAALFWLIAFGLGGAALVSVGVAMQFGLGYSLVAAGLFCVFYAGLILRGMTSG